MCQGLVPEIRLAAKYEARIAGKAVSNFMAELEGHPVGFTVGFPEEGLFYIYLFGVAPQHRNRELGNTYLIMRSIGLWRTATTESLSNHETNFPTCYGY